MNKQNNNLSNLTVSDHPLVWHKISILRDTATGSKEFTELIDELSTYLLYAATENMPTEKYEVETPLEKTEGCGVNMKNITLVPILRAGLGMVEGARRAVPDMHVGHIGLERDEETLEPNDYYFKVPPEPENQFFILADPMLATGGTMSAAADFLKKEGAKNIRAVTIVSAPEGVRHMQDKHPDIQIYTASLDRELDENGYILPGLGDAGDRLFGTLER